MKTIDYLFGPDAAFWWPVMLAALAMALLSGALSVFVVGRRLAFVGQGVSHTAFGGVGLAAVLGFAASGALTWEGDLLVALFCLGAALLIGFWSGKAGHREDTLIGIVLVASMALGMLLMYWKRQSSAAVLPSFESVLFGSLLGIGKGEAIVAWVACAAALLVMWPMRRALVFVAFDEDGAQASGVPTAVVRAVLMALLGLAIVVVMKLAGVVLASAMLVLPGATADAITKRLRLSVALSIAVALLTTVCGLVLSFEANWPTGPCVVTTMVGAYLLARAGSALAHLTRKSNDDSD